MAGSKGLRPSLQTYLGGFVVSTGALATAAFLLLGERRLDRFEGEVLAEIAQRRANAVEALFARALWEDWRDVKILAATVSEDGPATQDDLFDLVVGDGSRVSWAGYASLDGVVQAASGGMLAGASVAARPWFTFGLEGPFAGDVHEAKLLATLLPAAEGEPPRFLDLAAPATDRNGLVRGVVGFHLNHAWANALLVETAAIVGVEAVIVNRERQVVIGPRELLGESLSLRSFGAAGVGAVSVALETWPDGRQMLSAVIPRVEYKDLPSFGWSLIARIEPDAVTAPRDSFTRSIAGGLLALAAFVILATLAFLRFFVRPFDLIARDAKRIADGDDIYPHESRRTRELAHLSEAIVRLQTRITRR